MSKGLAALIQAIRLWLGRKPEAEDPDARVRVPEGKGPRGRSAAAVVQSEE